MLLVHVLPALGGVDLSFKELNTFTFASSSTRRGPGSATTTGSSSTPTTRCASGFFGAVRNTAVYTFCDRRAGRSRGGLAVALLLNRADPRAAASSAR